MWYKFNVLVFIVVLKVIVCDNSENYEIGLPKIQLSVYYESNDVESKRFIVRQLVPTMNLLHRRIRLSLIPFGKAKSIKYGSGGFKCRHGESECLGNMVQDCALSLMYKKTDLERLNYVVCEMKTGAGLRGNPRCLKAANVSNEDVVKCISSSEGIQLQLSSEYLTNIIQPKYIPAVVINGIYESFLDDYAQSNLTGAVCSVMADIYPCATFYNQIALEQILHPLYKYRHNLLK